jgi:hypothetical protein
MNLTKDRNKWRLVVHTIMNVQVPQNAGIASCEKKLFASGKGLYSLECVGECLTDLLNQVVIQ